MPTCGLAKSPLIQFKAAVLWTALLSAVAGAEQRFAVFKSTDAGQSWARSDAGMSGRSRINAFGSAGGVLLAGTDTGILISTDEALTWRPASGAALASQRVLSFATFGRRVFAGTAGNGLLVSSDGGESWAVATTFPVRKVRCLLAVNDKLFAGTDDAGVFVFPDGTQNWVHASTGLPSGAQIFALAAVDGRVFAGLYSRGLFAWDEQKRSWSKVGGVTPLAVASVGRALIAGHNPGGLYWSEDLGATWSKGTAASVGPNAFSNADDGAALAAESPVWEMASNGRVIFAGASAGIYYSQDHGRTWRRARAGLPAECPGIAFLAQPEFTLAAASLKGNE